MTKQSKKTAMPAKTQFSPRKLMEKAIQVMRDSIHEPRVDGKASPIVGALLYKPDGSVETACRGELRYGDHAEFTLLERKNRNNKLDGSILFTTLEPCAPGARSHPKLSCAERVVLARIKEMWVGLEDPDPKVDRKGIKYLQNNGVIVHMFDRDLQEIIRNENRTAFEQALERAEEAEKKKKAKIVELSSLERVLKTSLVEDFSNEALEQYRTRAKIQEGLGSSEFNRKLLQQGLLKEENGNLVPTGFGILLFGKEPRNAIRQAGLLATIHHPDGTEETRDFDNPMVLIPSLVEKWLTDKLPSIIDRSAMQRRNVPPLPFEMVREAVVNALIHRDYEIVGGKCQLVITADTIVVKSPGAPLPPITLEQLQSFNAPMLSRNPDLHYVFARMELAEERGLGIKTLKSRSEKLGLPLPTYAFEDPYLVLTLYRTPESAGHLLAPALLEKMNADDRAVWQFVASKDSVTSPQLMEKFEFDERKAQRVLRKLVQLELLRKVGKGPATKYEVVRK